MSSKLKPVDLTGAAVGFSGTIDFNQFSKFAPNDMRLKAHIRILNESGCGLDLSFSASGNSHSLPAGGWGIFDVEPNDGSVTATVTYTLPNPPVSLLLAIYYPPGEAVPQAFTLGNSPIGIGGTVTTSSIQTLSNETNPVNTLVVDIGVAGTTLLLQIFTDHFIWSVLQAGVAHQVLKGATSGNPLQMGQAGDISEVLGNLTVDGNTSEIGNLDVFGAGGIVSHGGPIQTFNANNISSAGDVIVGSHTLKTVDTITDDAGNSWAAVTAGATTRIQSGGAGQIVLQIPGGTTIMTVNAAGFAVTGTGSTTGDFSCSGVNFGTGTIHRVAKQTANLAIGTNAYTHNLGWQPDAIFLIATVGGGASDTVGWNTATTTTVNLTCGAALHHDLLFLKY